MIKLLKKIIHLHDWKVEDIRKGIATLSPFIGKSYQVSSEVRLETCECGKKRGIIETASGSREVREYEFAKRMWFS